jgi:hypothetical protein
MPQTLDIQPKRKKKLSLRNLNLHVKDISFANLFWKKFVIRLFMLLIASSVLLSLINPIIVEWNDRVIDSELAGMSLHLGDMVSSDMPNDRIQTTTNVMLSKIYERFESNRFITQSSITAYNVDSKNVIAKSFSIASIESDDIIEQWKHLSGIAVGEPIVHLSQDIRDFCEKYSNEKIRVDKLCFVNSILIPVTVTAVDKKGEDLDTCDTLYSSTAQVLTSYQPIWLYVIGNAEGDLVHKAMSTFKYETNEYGAVSVAYEDTIDDKIAIKSKSFTVNNCKYQIDCGYQINFWSGALTYVLIIELLAVLFCALSALINTKETLSVLH